MKVVEEFLELNRNISGMSETDIAVSTGEGLQELWKYQVPVGHSLVFKKSDHFATYLENSSSAEVAAGSLVDVAIMDANKQTFRTLLGQIRYAQARGSASTFLAFQDRDYFNHLDIQEGEAVVAEEGEFIVIRANCNATVDASDSYFILTCTRVRKTIF